VSGWTNPSAIGPLIPISTGGRRAATIGGEGWADAFAPLMLRSILAGPNIGQAWVAQASAAILLIASCLTKARFSAGLLLISLTIRVMPR